MGSNPGAQDGRGEAGMRTRTRPRNPAPCAQETVNGSNKASGAIGTGKCEACLKKLRPGHHGERKRFCSLGCRRLAWAVRELSGALEAGAVEGLRSAIRKLGRAA